MVQNGKLELGEHDACGSCEWDVESPQVVQPNMDTVLACCPECGHILQAEDIET